MKFSTFDQKVNLPDIGLLVLRLGLGIMFLLHGWPKLTAGPELWTKIGMALGSFGITFYPAFWGLMAALAEFGGGFCLITGLFFRPAMIFLVVTMIVAASSQIAGGQGLNGASHAIEDAIMFLGLFFIGPGKYTVINLFQSKKI